MRTDERRPAEQWRPPARWATWIGPRAGQGDHAVASAAANAAAATGGPFRNRTGSTVLQTAPSRDGKEPRIGCPLTGRSRFRARSRGHGQLGEQAAQAVGP